MDKQIKKVEEALKKTFGVSCQIPVTEFKLNIKPNRWVTFTLSGAVMDKNGKLMFYGKPYLTVSDVLENIGQGR